MAKMTKAFHVTIASVSENLFDGEAVSVTLPGTEGQLTVLAGHEPLVTTLKEGVIEVVTVTGEVRKFSVASGVLEVSNNQATVIL